MGVNEFTSLLLSVENRLFYFIKIANPCINEYNHFLKLFTYFPIFFLKHCSGENANTLFGAKKKIVTLLWTYSLKHGFHCLHKPKLNKNECFSFDCVSCIKWTTSVGTVLNSLSGAASVTSNLTPKRKVGRGWKSPDAHVWFLYVVCIDRMCIKFVCMNVGTKPSLSECWPPWPLSSSPIRVEGAALRVKFNTKWDEVLATWCKGKYCPQYF